MRGDRSFSQLALALVLAMPLSLIMGRRDGAIGLGSPLSQLQAAIAPEVEERKALPISKLCQNFQPQFTLAGHLSPVTAMAVSADSKTLVSGDRNGVVNVWNWETGKLLHELAAYPGEVRAIAITPDGNSIVTASVMEMPYAEKDEIVVKHWKLQTGELIQAVTKKQGDRQTLDSLDLQTTIRVSEMGENKYSYTINIEFFNRATGAIVPPPTAATHLEQRRNYDEILTQTRNQKITATATVKSDISFIGLQNTEANTSPCTVPRLGAVQSMLFTPDGQRLIVAGQKIDVLSLNLIPVILDRATQQPKIQHLNQLGFDKLKRKQYFSASRHFWKVFELHRQLADEQGQIDALYNIAQAHYALCQIGRGRCPQDGYYRRLYELVLPYFQKQGDRDRAAISLQRNKPNAHERDSGSSDNEEKRYRAALKKYRSLGNRKAEADTLVKIALINPYRNQNEQESLLKPALNLYRAVGNRKEGLEVLYALGLSYSGILRDKDNKPLGWRTTEAITYLQAAIVLSREMGDRFLESSILLDLGDSYRWGKQYSKALASYQSSLDIRRSLGDETGEDILLYRTAQTLRSLGQYQLALEAYQKTLAVCRLKNGECLDMNREYDLPSISRAIFQEIGEVYFALKQYPEALNYFQQETDYSDVWVNDKNLGMTYEKLGNIDLALKYFNKILSGGPRGCGDGAIEDATIVEAIRQDNSMANDGGTCQGYRETWIPSLSIATFHTAEIYRRRGQYDQAIDMYEKSLARLRWLKATILNNLGALYKAQGDYEKALKTYQEALWIRRSGTLYRYGEKKDLGEKDVYGEAVSLNNIGEIYRRQGKYPESLEIYQQSLAIFRNLISSLTDTQAKITPFQDISTIRQGEASVLHNFGSVYYDLGQHEQALDFYNQALTINQTLDDKAAQGRSLNNIGLTYEAQKQYAKALDTYQQALTARREADDRPGIAATLNNIGLLQIKLNQTSQGIEPLQQALTIFQNLEDKASQANTLDSLGTLYTALGQYSQALSSYQTALGLVKAVNLPPLEGVIFSNLGNLLVKNNQPELAIVFYKQSVNLTETIRDELRSLPLEQQKSYTSTVANTYRTLADLLLKQDRILEAQEVLELLKIQEFDNTFKETRGQRPAVTFRKAEIEFLKQFNAQQEGSILAAQELTTLENKPEAQLTKQDHDRIDELNRLQAKLADDFIQFINSQDVKTLVGTLRRQDSGGIDPETLDKLRNKFSNQLARLPNTALFYPLILDDRLELILITAHANPIRRTVKIDRPTLNQAIADFRLALKNPNQDPKPSAQKLYSLLIQPIIDDLQKANIKTLLYSPDRRLRYVPLGALHDGNQWLIERLQISYITAASITDLTTPRQPQPKVLAGAISDRPEQRYAVDVPPIHREFDGLPNVLPEITGIATQLPNTRQLLAQDFTTDAIQTLSRQYNILHFATHGSFERQEPELSFILFGGKSRDGKNYATLRDIGTWKLDADLVVLSACETGLADDQFDTKADDSVAVMGLGYKFEQAGARATIASLWVVNDASTALMMQRFYQQLSQAKLTKAAALQNVQQQFITGKLTAQDAPTRDADVAKTLKPGARSLPHSTDFSHPYYWAPFILIGNSL